MKFLPKVLLLYSTVVMSLLFVVGVVTSRSNSSLLFQLLLLPVVLYLIYKILKKDSNQIESKASIIIIAIVGFIILTSISAISIVKKPAEVNLNKNEKSITTFSTNASPSNEIQYVFIELNSEDSYVNIRSEANINASAIGQAIDGERFELIEELDQWYKVSTTREEGFINKDYAVKN